MKIGNLYFFRLCGCIEIFFGPNPFCGVIAGLIILTLFTFVLVMMSSAIMSEYCKNFAHVTIGANVLIFLMLHFSNPGIPPQLMPKKRSISTPLVPQQLPSVEQFKLCGTCERKFNLQGPDLYSYEPIEHCRECGVCVERMDHHCGFFDRCIGKKNLCLFYGVIAGFMCNMSFIMISVMVSTAL